MEVTGGLVIPDVEPGEHTLSLSGVACNCTLAAPGAVAVAVTAGDTADASFAITCEEIGRLALADVGDIYRVDLDGSGRTRLTHRAQRPIASLVPGRDEDRLRHRHQRLHGRDERRRQRADHFVEMDIDLAAVVVAGWHQARLCSPRRDVYRGPRWRRTSGVSPTTRTRMRSRPGPPVATEIAFISSRGPGEFGSDIYSITPDGSRITSLSEGGIRGRDAGLVSRRQHDRLSKLFHPGLDGLHIMTLDGSPLPYCRAQPGGPRPVPARGHRAARGSRTGRPTGSISFALTAPKIICSRGATSRIGPRRSWSNPPKPASAGAERMARASRLGASGARWVRAAACAIVAAGCGDDGGGGGGPTPEGLQILSGSEQVDTIAAELPMPLVVQVFDAPDHPAAGIEVQVGDRTCDLGCRAFSITRPRAPSQLQTTLETDETGQVTVLLRLGTIPGSALVPISVPSLQLADTARYTVEPGNAVGFEARPIPRSNPAPA